MVFKLVRIDTQEPCKIQLSIGTHVIGRGKFLHNDATDKRVSRNHAQLEVTADTVHLKSLHQNPCFFIKEGVATHLLTQDSTVNLGHGDKFGLLPAHFWYEVLYCPDQDIAEERTVIPEPSEDGVHNDEEDRMDQTEERTQNNVTPEISADAEDEAINFEDNEEEGDAIRSASPSLLTAEQEIARLETDGLATAGLKTDGLETAGLETDGLETAGLETDGLETAGLETDGLETARLETNDLETVNQETTQEYEVPSQEPLVDETRSPAKRNNSSRETSPFDVKRVKTEQVDPNDATAGPSNGQQPSSDTDRKDNIAAPASPAKPARERCIYGANCYRRNPQHKAQFSHPRDPDWGSGERGVCPYGRACRRADPRHWARHSHPPDTHQPAPNAHRPGKRQKRRQRNDSVSEDSSTEDSPASNLIVTGKRARKTVNRQDWSGAESEGDEDPYKTDESDEWQPPSDVTTSQDFSADI